MAKQDEPAGLSPAQMEIMNAVWARPGGASVAEVWKDLATRRRVARNTVQTMLVPPRGRGRLSLSGPPSPGGDAPPDRRQACRNGVRRLSRFSDHGLDPRPRRFKGRSRENPRSHR
jgi:hypothetical protein